MSNTTYDWDIISTSTSSSSNGNAVAMEYVDDYEKKKISGDIFGDIHGDIHIELKLESKIAQIIFNTLFKELSLSPRHIGLFATKGSELYSDIITISRYYELNATTPYSGDMPLQCLDVCIIDNVIDKMESMMQKGNIIKEALQGLRKNYDYQPYLIIYSKETGKEELESIALFAGVRKIIESKCLEDLEHTCIVVI